jgi:hypothetical protein
MFLLCLIATVSGTPLRQAEAAEDFARAHGEFGRVQAIEEVDGCVGDDSGATILKASGDSHSLPTSALPAEGAFLTPLVSASSLPIADERLWADRLASLPAGSVQRNAWLQCFLF